MTDFSRFSTITLSNQTTAVSLDQAKLQENLRAMLALQKWLQKQKKFHLPKHSVAGEAAKRLDQEAWTSKAAAKTAIDECHHRLLSTDTQVLVCQSGSCDKKLPCKMNAKTRSALSLEEDFVVKPAPCMGECNQGPNIRVVHDGEYRQFTALRKPEDIQAVLDYARSLTQGGKLKTLPGNLLKHTKGRIKEI